MIIIASVLSSSRACYVLLDIAGDTEIITGKIVDYTSSGVEVKYKYKGSVQRFFHKYSGLDKRIGRRPLYLHRVGLAVDKDWTLIKGTMSNKEYTAIVEQQITERAINSVKGKGLNIPIWVWLIGAAALAGGLYYYFMYGNGAI